MTAAGIYALFDQQQRADLDHARALAAAGVPIFIAKPARDTNGDWQPDSGAGGCGYWLPQGWQHTKADPATIDAWEPGDALAAVMGHGLDLLDVDPRSGGDDTLAGMRGAGIVPATYAEAATPSGGWHGFVASLGVGSRDGIASGVDVKAGTRQGDGRGFAFIAPTVRLSKSTGELTAYRWTSPPDIDRYALEAAEDDTGEALADLVRAARRERTAEPATGATGALSTVSDALAPSPWDDVPATLAEGRHHGVVRLASALRGRGGWRVEDALAYMRAVVFPQIDQGQGGHPYTLEEFAADVRDVFTRYEDGRPGVTPVTPASSDAPDGDPGAFALDVTAEAHRIRVREAARQLVATENAPPAAPFDVGLLGDVLNRPAPDPYRVDGLIPAEAGTLLVAQRKAGKTTLNLNYARALLTGAPLLDRFDVRPLTGRVAFLNFEVSGHTLARWADEAGVPRDRLFLVNLRGRRNPFAHPDDLAALAELLREHDTEAMIVDPFGRAYHGTSQNDPGEVGQWLTKLDEFTRSDVGATDLVLTAHAGWNGERVRGASALEDWADSIITLTTGQDEDATTRYLRAVGRDVDLEEDRLEFDPHTRHLSLTGQGSRRTARQDRAIEAAKAEVMQYVTANPGCSGNDIQTAVDGRNDVIAKARRELVQSGELLEERRKGRGGGKAFRVADSLNPEPLPSSPNLSPGDVGTSPTSPYRGEVPMEKFDPEPLPPPKAPTIDLCPRCAEPLDGPPLFPSCPHAEATA